MKVESSIQIAEKFGKYFSQIGKEFANKIDQPLKDTKEYLNKISYNSESLFLHPTSSIEISKLIDKLPNKTSSGHDEISNIILKKIKNGISTPLGSLMNKSLQEGQVPDIMKIADVIPLYINQKARKKQITTDQYHY